MLAVGPARSLDERVQPPHYHPVFDRFEPQRFIDVPPDIHVDFLGDRYRTEYVGLDDINETPRTPPFPALNEEYFEWIDLLESVIEAGPSFTFLELGAGYGRWATRAARAAERCGKRARLGLAEAHPQHIDWIAQTMRDNAIQEDSYRIFPQLVAGAHARTAFCIQQPDDMLEARWFGQARYWTDASTLPVTGEYRGRPVRSTAEGWKMIEVEQVPLSHVVAEYDFIDLIDFDLQGSEAEAIAEGVGLLTQRVRRLHIGTHGKGVEAALRETLAAAGWICLRDFCCHQVNETEYGPVSFVDGVQSWVNPQRE